MRDSNVRVVTDIPLALFKEIPRLVQILFPTALRVLVVGLLCATASAQNVTRPENAGEPRSNVPANAKEIALKGERVCLQQRPDKNGQVTLDCAIGFRGDDDRFYGLRASDPTRVEPFAAMNARILVIGKLLPAVNDRYEEAGQIVYTSIQSIDGDPKRVVGTFMCLLHGVPGVASADECRSVIKTQGGLYWGLESRSLDSVGSSRGLKRGERISLEGELLADMPEDWHPWAWGSNRIQGVLKVASLKKL